MKLLKPFIIACISGSVLILAYKLASACSWYPGDEVLRFCVFDPTLAPAPELRPLIYTSDVYLKNYSNEVLNDSVYQRNVNEWSDYVRGMAANKDIYSVLYSLTPIKFFNSTDSLAEKNSFIKYLKQNDAEGFHYIDYAKQCEQIINYPDPWDADEDNEGIDNAAAIRLIKEGEVFYKNTKSDFLKLHIAFQLERLFFYEGDVKGIDDDKKKVYAEKIVLSKLNSWIKNSAFYYYTIKESDALEGYATAEQCNYALALAFDKAIDKRFRCVQLFRKKQLDGTLALAKSNHERVVINTMYQLQYPGENLAGIHTVYQLEPDSKYLSFLLVREVNKLEDWIMGSEISGFGYSPTYSFRDDITEQERDNLEGKKYSLQRKEKDVQYLIRVTNFINAVIADGKQPDKALLKLMVAHLYIIEGDTSRASAALKDAEKVSLSAGEKKQITICRLMLRVITNPAIDAETEKMIMEISKGTRSDEKEQEEDDTVQSVADQVLFYAGKKMMDNGNFTEGLLLLNRTQCYIGDGEQGEMSTYELLFEKAKSKQYEEVFALLDKKNKTPFESFLANAGIDEYYAPYDDVDANPREGIFNKYRVLDFEAMYFINRDSLENALAILNRIPDTFWDTTEPYKEFKHRNPFNIEYLTLCTDSMMRIKDNGNWNKRKIIKRILELKKEVVTNLAKRAIDYKELGSAYYSMSYYGKCWFMNTWFRSGAEPWGESRTAFDMMYYGCPLAEKYFLLAAKNGKNFESAAFCYYMAGQCRENYNSFMFYSDKKYAYGKYKPKVEYPFAKNIKLAFPDIVKRLGERDPTDCTYYEDFLDAAAKM